MPTRETFEQSIERIKAQTAAIEALPKKTAADKRERQKLGRAFRFSSHGPTDLFKK